MIFLSQRDLRWAGLKLGSSKLTVGRFGCTTTCISMLSDYFKCFATPGELAQGKVVKHDLLKYTAQGLLIWKSLNLKKMDFEKRVYGRVDYDIEKSLKDPKKAVILAVNDDAHWVVATSINKFYRLLGRNVYNIIDPWDGKKKTTRAFKNISGSAHFIAK